MVALFFADTTIQLYSQSKRGPVSDGFNSVANYLGWGWTTLPALSLLYGYGWISDSPRPRQAALLSLKAFAFSQLATETLKHLTHRHRPNAGDGPMHWDGPSFSPNNLSFASGHATTAFAVATTCAMVYRDKPLLNISLYTIASLTALSRISKNSHWASDVFVGSIIGYSTARFLVERYDTPSTPDVQLTTLPTSSGLPAVAIRIGF
jgi:membrane-associated phospholipid phosphatase